jgi:Predicted transcriptional regulator, contains C-terminal CBS domains
MVHILKMGEQMIRVKDAMQSDVITVKRTSSIHEAARVLRENRISGAPVVDEDGKLVGIISEGDIMRLIEVHSPSLNLIMPSPLDLLELPLRMKHEYDEIARGIRKAAVMRVEEIMTPKVVTVPHAPRSQMQLSSWKGMTSRDCQWLMRMAGWPG